MKKAGLCYVAVENTVPQCMKWLENQLVARLHFPFYGRIFALVAVVLSLQHLDFFFLLLIKRLWQQHLGSLPYQRLHTSSQVRVITFLSALWGRYSVADCLIEMWGGWAGRGLGAKVEPAQTIMNNTWTQCKGMNKCTIKCLCRGLVCGVATMVQIGAALSSSITGPSSR